MFQFDLFVPTVTVGDIGTTVATATTQTMRDYVLRMNDLYSDITDPTPRLFPLVVPSSLNPSNLYYSELNNDRRVQKTITKHFYYKILDKWLYNELLPLLAFLKINKTSGGIDIIGSMDEFDIQSLAKDTDAEIEAKVRFMEENIITKKLVKHVLESVCKDNHIKWYELKKYEKHVRKVFYNYIYDKLKKVISV